MSIPFEPHSNLTQEQSLISPAVARDHYPQDSGMPFVVRNRRRTSFPHQSQVFHSFLRIIIELFASPEESGILAIAKNQPLTFNVPLLESGISVVARNHH